MRNRYVTHSIFGTLSLLLCCLTSGADAQLRPSYEFKMVYYEMKLGMCSPLIKYCAGDRYAWLKGESTDDELVAMHAMCQGALDRLAEITRYDPNAEQRIKLDGLRHLNDLPNMTPRARNARLTGCRDFLLYGR